MAMGSELSAADIAAVTNGGGYGNGEWWILLLLLFGWGGRGYGSGGSCASTSDVYSAIDQQTLISKLDNQTYGIADATYSLNNTIVNGFHGVENSLCRLSHQMSDDTRDIIDNQNCNTRAIIDLLNEQRMAEKDAKIFELQMAASQAAQNNYLLNQLRPAPVPAYITCNPNVASFGFSTGGCGCGCGGFGGGFVG